MMQIKSRLTNLSASRFLHPIVALCLLVLLTSCGQKAETAATSSSSPGVPAGGPPSSPRVSACKPGVRGKRLVFVGFADPKTFNPISANEMSSIYITDKLNRWLVYVDVPTQQAYPGLAESWTVEPDHKTWTFHLRKGLRWSDGEPLTTDDVIFTWNDVIYN